MEEILLSSAKELGIAIVAVLTIGYICREIIKDLKETRTNYQKFVTENNHQKTEMIREHTQTLVQVRHSIEANTKQNEKMTNAFDQVVKKIKK
jgi:uncharacterized membrane protein YraQ (UPF0718 family)